MAVTFEDGTSAGDPEWLSNLHARRESAYREIAELTQLLNRAVTQHEANNQIVSSLKELRASLTGTGAAFGSRGAAELVIRAAVSNLEVGSVGGVVGDPQRTIPSIILPIFAEWRGALQRYDTKVN